MSTLVEPFNEAARLALLKELDILDTEPEAEFESIVRAAAAVCGMPISLISLVDHDRQWFKANVGLEGVSETPREVAFCSHTILGDELLEINDARRDPRFADNALVTQSPDIRFYAGAPLRMDNGLRVGTLCVIDTEPRELSDQQREVLLHLSRVAAHALQSRRTARALIASETHFRTLCEAAPLGIFGSDVDGRNVFVNKYWQSIFNMNELEASNGGWAGALHSDDRERVLEQWRLAKENKTVFDEYFRIKHRDGRELSLHSNVRSVVTDDNVLLGHVGTVRDITDHKNYVDMLHRHALRAEQTGRLAKVGGWELDLITSEISWSDEASRIFGLPLHHEPSLYELLQQFEPSCRKRLNEAMERAITEGTGVDIEVCLYKPEGKCIWVRVVCQVDLIDGQAVSLRGAVQDIDESVMQRRELENANERMTLATESGQIGVWELDLKNQSLTWSAQMYKLFGVSKPPETITYEFWAERVHPEDLAKAEKSIRDAINGDSELEIKFRIIWPDQSIRFIRASAHVTRDSAGNAIKILGVNWDVTSLHNMNAAMLYRATHDELTKVYNRSEFEACLQQSLYMKQDSEHSNALMFIDLDQFKLVNDTCGHTIGDQLLRQVALMLGQCIRDGDVLGRLGGDEFGVILQECDAVQALSIAQSICDRMEDFRFSHGDKRFRVGASIGLVRLDGHWANKEAAMQAADTSCYAAKEAGRNRVHVWFDTDQALRNRRDDTQWAARLEQALDDNQFMLYAQHLQSISRDGEAPNIEVLLRLKDGRGDVILPGAFLPAAERFHLVTRLDRWVLKKSIAALCELRDLSSIGKLWVNLSGQSVGDRVFHQDAIRMLDRAGPEICERICLEITETAAVTNIADAAKFITDLKKLGVCSALDDFGAGASSFGYLKGLPVDYLKIDGQFISNLMSDSLDAAAVRCFVDVANVVGLNTVAEHVDCPEVLGRLRELGVDYAQGFMLHNPEPIRQVLERMPVGTGTSEARHAVSI